MIPEEFINRLHEAKSAAEAQKLVLENADQLAEPLREAVRLMWQILPDEHCAHIVKAMNEGFQEYRKRLSDEQKEEYGLLTGLSIPDVIGKSISGDYGTLLTLITKILAGMHGFNQKKTIIATKSILKSMTEAWHLIDETDGNSDDHEVLNDLGDIINSFEKD